MPDGTRQLTFTEYLQIEVVVGIVDQEALRRRWALERAEAAKAAPKKIARKKVAVKKPAPARVAKKGAPVKKAAVKKTAPTDALAVAEPAAQ